jgi:hypothetical protein
VRCRMQKIRVSIQLQHTNDLLTNPSSS